MNKPKGDLHSHLLKNISRYWLHNLLQQFKKISFLLLSSNSGSLYLLGTQKGIRALSSQSLRKPFLQSELKRYSLHCPWFFFSPMNKPWLLSLKSPHFFRLFLLCLPSLHWQAAGAEFFSWKPGLRPREQRSFYLAKGLGRVEGGTEKKDWKDFNTITLFYPHHVNIT